MFEKLVAKSNFLSRKLGYTKPWKRTQWWNNDSPTANGQTKKRKNLTRAQIIWNDKYFIKLLQK